MVKIFLSSFGRDFVRPLMSSSNQSYFRLHYFFLLLDNSIEYIYIGDICFHFEFFALPSRSEQLSRASANEIKHDHSPVVIVLLDPRYDLSRQALYTYSRSIAQKIVNQSEQKFFCTQPMSVPTGRAHLSKCYDRSVSTAANFLFKNRLRYSIPQVSNANNFS